MKTALEKVVPSQLPSKPLCAHRDLVSNTWPGHSCCGPACLRHSCLHAPFQAGGCGVRHWSRSGIQAAYNMMSVSQSTLFIQLQPDLCGAACRLQPCITGVTG